MNNFDKDKLAYDSRLLGCGPNFGKERVMIEHEWFTCADVRAMWKYIRPQNLSGRKHRLFAVAVCRFLWDRIDVEPLRHSVEVAERFVDGKADEQELKIAFRKAKVVPIIQPVAALGGWSEESVPGRIAMYASCLRYYIASDVASVAIPATMLNPSIRPNLLRDIVGNPFRNSVIEDVWKTPTVLRLAETMYEQRHFEDMPILGDALEDVGCDVADILDHCRKFPVHVRGCWLVDQILEK